MEPIQDAYAQLQAENASLQQRIAALESSNAQLERQVSEQTQQLDLFRSLLDDAPEAMGVVTSEGQVFYANSRLKALYHDLDVGETNGSLASLQAQLSADGILHQVQQRGMWQGIITQQRANGSRSSLQLHAARMRYMLFDRHAIALNVHDITAQIEQETRFQESQALLQTLLDHSPAFVYIKDTRQRYVLVNQRLATLARRACSDFIGKTVDDIFPPYVGAATRRYDQHVLDTGEVVKREQMLLVDGEARTFLEIKFPIYDTQGKLYAIGGINTDITERKRLEERFQQVNGDLEQQIAARMLETRLFQTLVELAPDAVGMTTLDGTLTYINRTGMALFGQADTLIGTQVSRLYAYPQPALQESWREVLERGSWYGMSRYQRADGSTFLAQVSAVLLPDITGNPQAVGMIIRDMTASMQREDDLRASEERLQKVVQHMPVLLVAMTDNLIALWNQECERITGYQAHEIIGNPKALELFFPDPYHREAITQAMLLKGQNYRDWEWHMTVRDGSVRVISWSCVSQQCAIPGWGFWFVGVDVTERKRTEQILQESEQKYRTLFDSVPIALYRSTPDGRLLDANLSTAELLGYPDHATLLNQNVTSFYVYPEDREHWKNIVAREGVVRNFEMQLRRRDNEIIWVLDNVRGIFDTRGQLLGYEGSLEDITQRKLYQAQIEQLAFTDPLTGISNRRHLYDEGERLLAQARQHGTSMALLYLDLDRFKSFNDALGHDAGDELLLQVTRRLQGCVEGERDVLLARLGGDEFAVLMGRANVEQAIALAQRMLEHIRRPFLLHNQRVHLGGSIGIALGPMEEASFPALLTRADIAMYRVKASGGGVQVYDASFSLAFPDQLRLETDLRWALVTDSLTLYYQPILDVPTGRIVGAEALIRWWHPERGLLGPDAFLPLAEETGLMRVLDGWVLGTVLSQMAAWNAAGHTFDVAVNLTAYSLQNLELVTHIADLLTVTNVAPERVIIELTEHTALRDLATTQQVLTGLNDLGLRIALDDFGNGYASLTYLQQVPVDILKIDRTFTIGVGHNVRNEAVIRALLGLARDMGMMLVVEGVEEPAQLEWLKAAGCQWAQGFLIGKPMPPEMFSQML